MLKILKNVKSKVVVLLVAGALAPQAAFAGHGGGHGGGNGGGHGGGNGGGHGGGNGGGHGGGQQHIPQMQNMQQVQRFAPSNGPVIAAKNGNTGFTGIGLPSPQQKHMGGQMMSLTVPKNSLPNQSMSLTQTNNLKHLNLSSASIPQEKLHPFPGLPTNFDPVKKNIGHPASDLIKLKSPIGSLPNFPANPVGPIGPVKPPVGPIGPVGPINPVPPVTPPVTPPMTPPTAPTTPTSPGCGLPWLFPVGLGGYGNSYSNCYGNGYGNGGYYSSGYCAPVVAPAPVVIPNNAVAPVNYVAAAGSVDLVLEDIHLLEPATLVAGPAYRVKFRNQGLATAGAFRVGVIAALEGKMTDSHAVVDVLGLEAGQSVEIALRLPQSAMQLVSANGQVTAFDTLAVMVDVDGIVNESDKANNGAAIARSSLEAAR